MVDELAASWRAQKHVVRRTSYERVAVFCLVVKIMERQGEEEGLEREEAVCQ